MLSNEIKQLVEYINTRISTIEKKFQVKKGKIASIDANNNIANVLIYEQNLIKAIFDVNAGFQPGDKVIILSIGSDPNVPENNIIIGQYSGVSVPVSTANMLYNGNMENGTINWIAGDNIDSINESTDYPYMGNKCLSVLPVVSDTEAEVYQQTNTISCKPNEIYNVEAYFRTNSNTGALVRLRTSWYNASGAASYEGAIDTEPIYLTSGSQWIPISFTQISPPDASSCRVSLLFRMLEDNYPIYMDNVGLYGFYSPSGSSIYTAGNGIDIELASETISVDLAEDSGLEFISGELLASVDDTTISINESGELEVISSGISVAHTDLTDMPSSANTDHDGRYILDTADVIKDTHIDWGAGASQVNADDVPESSARLWVKQYDDYIMSLETLPSLASAERCVVLGPGAGQALHDGRDNVCVGVSAAPSLTDGYYNVAIGTLAMSSSQTGNSNVCIGYYAGLGTPTNSYSNNIFIGHRAADNVTTGSTNIVIAHDTNLPIVAGDNQLVIGSWEGGIRGDANGFGVNAGYKLYLDGAGGNDYLILDSGKIKLYVAGILEQEWG